MTSSQTRRALIRLLIRLVQREFSQLKSAKEVFVTASERGTVHVWTIVSASSRRVENAVYSREAIVMNELGPMLPLDWHLVWQRDMFPAATLGSGRYGRVARRIYRRRAG